MRALAPCSCQGQALGPRLRGCQEIRTVNPKSPIPSFPRKREPRDFSHLPWAPAFEGVSESRFSERRVSWRCLQSKDVTSWGILTSGLEAGTA